MTDLRVLAALADAMGRDLGVRQTGQALAELDELGAWTDRPTAKYPAAKAPAKASGLVLASWRQLIDGSASNAGSDALLATAHAPVVRLSPASAAKVEAANGDPVVLSAGGKHVTLPLVIEPTMVDGVAWLPGNYFTGSIGELAVSPGASVTVTRGGVK